MDLSILERSIVWLQQGGPTGGQRGAAWALEREGEVGLGPEESR